MCELVRTVLHGPRLRMTGAFLALSMFALLPGSGCNFGQGPEVTSVEPSHGPPTGGTEVTIIGSSLEMPVAVTFNDVAATNLQFIHSRALTAVTPPGTPGPATVALIFADGSVVTIPDAFTYDGEVLSTAELPLTITAITPESGPTTGGTQLTIQGTNFVPEAVLLIDGQPALNLTYLGESLLTATTPPGAAGVAEVILNTGDGRSTDYPPGFTYLAPDSPDLPQPTITAVSPTAGPQAGGTTVTVQGTLFVSGSVVVFDEALAAQTTFVSSTILTAVTPAHPAGLSDISVVLPDARRVTLADAYEFQAPPIPTISSIAPANGPIAGGTPVTIQGSGFSAGTQVFFDHTAAVSVDILSAHSLVAVTPPHTAGLVDVAVQIPDGRDATTVGGFLYVAPPNPTINTIDPNTGPAAGGTSVTITGTDFRPGAVVLFGSVPASSVSVLNATTLTAVTPAHAAGLVDVTVTNSDSTTITYVDGFTFEPPVPLVVNSIDPNHGSPDGGTVVTLLGEGFTSGATVVFGLAAATDVTIVSDQILTAVSPPQPAGTVVPLTVTLPDGQSVTTADTFTYVPLPTITSLTPESGPEAGGTVVNIAGTNLGTATNVRFAGVAAPHFAVLSDTLIQAVTPPGSGAAVVRVVTPFDDAYALFTYVPPATATIAGLAPDSGPEAGDTIVTITGTALSETTDVTFGGASALNLTVLSDTLLEALTPPGTGAVTVEVQTPYGNPQALFTYVPPGTPSIGGLEPASGPQDGGTVVTITGTGFTGTSSVTFDGNPSWNFTVLSDTLLEAVTPPGAGGTTVVVDVQTPTGDALALFTYLLPDVPTISSVVPPSGPEAGGTPVVITGTGFSDALGVLFGLHPVPFIALSDTQIIALSYGGTGTVPLTVLTPYGAAATVFTYVPPETATIGSLDPSSGPEAGGTIVTISGTALGETSDITFGGASAAFTILSDTLLQAVSPPGAGTVVVQVQTPYGNPEALFSYVPPGTPTIGGLTPPFGPEAGGTVVTISGTGFADASNVRFAGVAAPHFSVLSDTLIQAETPPGTGTAVVRVVTPNGVAHALFTYVPPQTATIGSLDPSCGPDVGGTIVTITGTALGETAAVTFDGTPAAFTILSDTLLQAVTPPGTDTVVVQVQTPYGNAEALFTYVPPGTPTISGLTPPFGPEAGGTVVTISGTGFADATNVRFAGVAAPHFTVLSDTLIQAETPLGAGAAVVRVVTPNGNAHALFTYLPPATLSIGEVTPASGPEAGGTVVTITGTNLSSVTNVTFGAAAATFAVLSDESLQAVAPAGAGTVQIAVTNGAQTAFAYYTYIPPLVLSIGSIEPETGFFLGDTVVTITGTALSSVTGATIDGAPAAYEVLSDTTLQVVAPAHAIGTVVLAITDGTQSAAAYFTYTLLP
jgi:hypothetical protein